MMIRPINYSLLRADEFYTFTQRILEILEPLDLDDMKVKNWEYRIREKFMVLDQAFKKMDGKMLTLNLGRADSRRDAEFLGLRFYLQACNFRQNDDWTTASDFLLELIRKNGWSLQHESYNQETARLEDLIRDFETNQLAIQAIAKLNAGEWVNRVKNAQKDFDVASKAHDEVADSQLDVNVIDASKGLRRDMNLLFKYLDIMNELTPNSDYQKMAERIIEQVEQFMRTAKARRIRLQNQKVTAESE